MILIVLEIGERSRIKRYIHIDIVNKENQAKNKSGILSLQSFASDRNFKILYNSYVWLNGFT